jgi:hypothetical protein
VLEWLNIYIKNKKQNFIYFAVVYIRNIPQWVMAWSPAIVDLGSGGTIKKWSLLEGS